MGRPVPSAARLPTSSDSLMREGEFMDPPRRAVRWGGFCLWPLVLVHSWSGPEDLLGPVSLGAMSPAVAPYLVEGPGGKPVPPAGKEALPLRIIGSPICAMSPFESLCPLLNPHSAAVPVGSR